MVSWPLRRQAPPAQRLPEESQNALLKSMYDVDATTIFNRADYSLFLEVFTSERLASWQAFDQVSLVQLAQLTEHAVQAMRAPDAAQSRTGLTARRADVIDVITNTINTLELELSDNVKGVLLKGVQDLLDGMLRIWLMIDPSKLKSWKKAETPLCDAVHAAFYPSQVAPSFKTDRSAVKPPDGVTHEQIAAAQEAKKKLQTEEADHLQLRLTHDMTAASIDKFTDINISWQTMVDSNLIFDGDEQFLSIFANNAWLRDTISMIKSWQNSAEPPEPVGQTRTLPPFPIPLEVLEESVKVLDYFLPRFHGKSLAYLKEHNEGLWTFRRSLYGDQVDRFGTKVRLRDFDYFHDRLMELGQYFASPPKSWKSTWKDKRSPAQYWTFWIGLAIFVATILALAVSAAQLYYAAKSP